MANLNLDMPDDLARRLEGIAAAQHKSVQEIAVAGLRSLVELNGQAVAGSPAALLKAVRATPHLSACDVDELEAAISAGRILAPPRDPFPD